MPSTGPAFEYFTNQNLKAWPMRFGDAALNTGDKPEAELQPVRRHRRRPHQEEQGVLLRQLRVHARPPDRRQDGDGAAAGDAAGRSVRGRRRRSTILSREMRTAPGGRSSRCCPGDPNYALCNTATNPQCLNIIPGGPAWTRSPRRSPATSRPTTSTGSGTTTSSQAPFAFDRQQVDTKVDYNVNSKFNLAGTFGVLHYRTTVPTVFGDTAVGRAHRRQQQPGARERQHVPAHGDGHLHLQPDVPDGRALRLGQAGNGVGAAGPRPRTSGLTCWAFRAPTARAPSRAAGRPSSSRTSPRSA